MFIIIRNLTGSGWVKRRRILIIYSSTYLYRTDSKHSTILLYYSPLYVCDVAGASMTQDSTLRTRRGWWRGEGSAGEGWKLITNPEINITINNKCLQIKHWYRLPSPHPLVLAAATAVVAAWKRTKDTDCLITGRKSISRASWNWNRQSLA